MKFKKVLVATAMVGVSQLALLDMVMKQMRKCILKMDSYYMMMQTS